MEVLSSCWSFRESEMMSSLIGPPAVCFSAGSGMNLLDIRTRTWSEVCLDATAPHLDQMLGLPRPSASVLVRLLQDE